MSPGQKAPAGAHGAQDEPEEEVCGPHHPAEASQVLEWGLVRSDSQMVSSQQGVDRSPERTWAAELGGLGGPCWWQPGNGSAVETGEAPGVGGAPAMIRTTAVYQPI